MPYKKTLGDLGEKIAEKYLLKKGYKIIDRNYHSREGEVDLIALEKGQFVFIEVKTRSSENFGCPAEAVTYQKIKKLIKTARHFLFKTKKNSENYRIDVVSIILDKDNKRVKIKHFKSITNN